MTDGTETATDRPLGLPRWVGALLPLVLLLVVVALFLASSPFAAVESGQPLPDLTVTHATMPNDETVVLHVVNNGPESVTVSQVLIDEAYWAFEVRGSGGDRTLAPMESARVVVPYHWNPGWDLEAALVLSDGTTFHHTIVAPAETPGVTAGLLGTLALVGLFVGVVPVALGMLWFPYMRGLSDRTLHAVLAFSVGVLAFLAFDAGFEALELAAEVPGAYEGHLLVVLGAVGTLALVEAVGSGDGGDRSGLRLAYLVALGIGFHNLAEGLAIGGAFAVGRVSLGAFLVVGFMVHNVTEGPAVVAPVARGDRPALVHFAALGAIAGAPVIVGGWVGSLAFSPTLAAFFLAVGVGAIAQVSWEIVRLIGDRGRVASPANLLAALAGLVVMYATDLLVAL